MTTRLALPFPPDWRIARAGERILATPPDAAFDVAVAPPEPLPPQVDAAWAARRALAELPAAGRLELLGSFAGQTRGGWPVLFSTLRIVGEDGAETERRQAALLMILGTGVHVEIRVRDPERWTDAMTRGGEVLDGAYPDWSDELATIAAIYDGFELP